MKRDIDLVRELLFKIQALPAGELWRSPKVEGYERSDVYHHLELMEEAGLIKANFMKSEQVGIAAAVVERLTWQGQEFADAAQNQTVWQKAKDKIVEFGGSLPLIVLQSLLIDLAKKQIGL